MSFVLADRVKETTTSPGTGTATLSGAVTGYQSFSAGIGANNTTYYVIADASGANWEVGYGTVGAGGTTLARTTVLASSNSNSLVDFSSGTQNVWVDYPAGKAILLDSSGNISQTIASITNISGAITTPDSITFDITPETVPTAQGSLYWDSADSTQTLSLVMEGGNAIQQIGEETYFRIKCSAAVTEGQVVMFTGTVGSSGGLTGAPATGLTASTASYVMGVATESGALNDWIYVTAFGLVRNIDTTGGAEAWIDGQILYYDPTVTGGLTKTLPSAPNAKVQVCAVVHAASNGSLFIRPAFGGALGQYEGDVQVTTPANGDLLIRNQTSGKWVNAPLTAGTGVSVTNTAGAITVANTGVTSVTGTSPVASSGGATPAISLASGYGDTQNPYASKTANYILAAPSGSAGVPTFRAVTAADLGTGTASSSNYLRGDLTWQTISSGITVTNDTSTATALYPTFTSATSGTISGVSVTSTKLTFVPSTGALSSTSVAGTSDERLKTNWRQVAPDFLEKLANVKSGIYDRNDVVLTQAGVSAQSLQEVLPEAVLDNGDGYLAVAYGNAALVAAIELAKEVKALRAEVELLKAK